MRNLVLIIAAIVLGLGARLVARKLESPQIVQVEPSALVPSDDVSAPPEIPPTVESKPESKKEERPLAPVLAGAVEDLRPSETLWVSGVVVRGQKINVLLSDGRIYTERDKELTAVERNSATISGLKIFYRPAVAVGRTNEPKVESSATGGASGKGTLVHVDVTAGPEIDARLPKAGMRDGKIDRYLSALADGESELAAEARRAFTDPIHHE